MKERTGLLHGGMNNLRIFFFTSPDTRSYPAQDFKPANCMLCSDGLVKITDFGAVLRLRRA